MNRDPSTHLRSIVKGFTWESFSFALTLAVAMLVLGDVKVSLKLTCIAQGLKIIFYWGHERVWAKTRWGKINP